MKGPEGLEGLGSQRGSERFGLPIEAPPVQMALMLIAYREAHKNDEHPPVIDLVDLEHGNGAVEVAAGDEWVVTTERHPVSFAKVFHAYRTSHPHQVINTSDEQELASLLFELKTARGSAPTLH